ncbi:MAG: hypothetical protein ACPGUZ_01255 [Holosporaceae bacterium]
MLSSKIFFCAVTCLLCVWSVPCGFLRATPEESIHALENAQNTTVLQENVLENDDLETIDVSLLESICFNDAPVAPFVQDTSSALWPADECAATAPPQQNVLFFDGVCFDDQPLAAFALSCYQQDPKVIKNLQSFIEKRVQHCDFCLKLLFPLWMKRKADLSIENLAEQCFKGFSMQTLLDGFRLAHCLQDQFSLHLEQRQTLTSMTSLIAQLFYEVGAAPESFHVMPCEFLGKPAEDAWKKGPFWCDKEAVVSSACVRLALFFRAEKRNKATMRFVLAPLLKGLCLLQDNVSLSEQMQQSMLSLCHATNTSAV